MNNKIIEYLADSIAIEDAGIYPKGFTDASGIFHPRTEKQQGWNDCAMHIAESSDKIFNYLEHLPDEVIDYITKEKIHVTAGDKVQLWVLCNDLFYWGYADGENFELDDLEDFKKAIQESEKHGELLWVCRKRGMRPQTPYYKYFTAEEQTLFDACGPTREE